MPPVGPGSAGRQRAGLISRTRQANSGSARLVSTRGRRRPDRVPAITTSDGCDGLREAAGSGPSTARRRPPRFRATGSQARRHAGRPRRAGAAADHRLLGRGGAALRLAGRDHPAGHRDARVLDGVGDRRAGRRRDHLGGDVLGGDLPPQARRRRHPAAADPVQPAGRDRLHGGPDDHRGGAVRVHRDRAELRRHRRAEPRPERRGPRLPVELALHLPGQPGRRRAAGHHGRLVRGDPAAGAADRPAHRVRAALQRRDPQLLRAGVPVQAGRLPDARGQRPGLPLADRPDRARGRLRRPLRRALRQPTTRR